MRLLPVLLLFGLLFASVAAFVPVGVRAAENPVLVLSSFVMNPAAIPPGGTAVANFTVKNPTVSPLFGATISFTANAPLTMVGTGSTFFIGDMNANSNFTFSATLGAIPSAPSGSYLMPYVLTYNNGTNGLTKQVLTSKGQINVPVSGTPVRPVLTLEGVAFNPAIVTPGSDFAMSVNITNTGNAQAFGSALNVLPQMHVSLVGSTGILNLASLDPGKSEIATVRMAAAPGAVTETVPVKFELTYIDKFGILYGSNSTYNVQITAQPDLRVGSFSLSSAPVRPGSTTGLTVSMINVGGDRAYDVKLVALSTFFLTGSTVNYLGAIDSGASASAAYYLSVSNDTAPGNYVLTLSFQYTDLKGNPYFSSKNYTIPVEPYTAPSVTVTNTVIDPPVISVGTQGTITVFLKNTGPTEARDVTISIDGGNGIVSSNYIGVGTMQPGDTTTQVIGVNVLGDVKPGSYTLTFHISYTDPSGTAYYSSAPLQTSVYAGVNLFSLVNVGIIIVVIIVAILAFILLRRYKVISF